MQRPRLRAGVAAFCCANAAAAGAPPVAIAEQQWAVDGQPVELFCPTTHRRDMLTVYAEPDGPLDGTRDLARELARHGWGSMVVRLQGSTPKERGAKILRLKSFRMHYLAQLGDDAPCASLRSCEILSTGQKHCGGASREWHVIVLGSAIGDYLEHQRQTVGSTERSIVLVDPNVSEGEVPDLKRESPTRKGIRTYGAPLQLVVTGRGRCHEGQEELVSRALEDPHRIDVAEAGHCDVVGGPTCAARCGHASSSSGVAAVRQALLDAIGPAPEASAAVLPPRIEPPSESEGYRNAFRVHVNLSMLAGGGVRTRPDDDARAVGIAALRPELVLGTHAWGVGPYAEAGFLGASRMSLGGGVSVVLQVGREVALTPAFGLFRYPRHEPDDAWTTGAGFGLFLGGRRNGLDGFDAPTGIRIDARGDLAEQPERAVFVAFHVDLIGMIMRVIYLGRVGS